MENGQDTGNPNVEDDFTTENQAAKSFSQDEVDRIVKERLSRERSKLLKQYEGVDLDRYRQLTEKEEQIKIEQEKARGNFEKVLQETVNKKDTHIQQLQRELQSIKVDGSLLNSASSRKAVNPQQVVRLLKDQIRLNQSGEVEILDEQGNVRFNDQGTAMTADELVGEFLKTNPHFIQAGPQGTGPQGNIAKSNGNELGKIDLANLNMNDPGDRAIYKKYMKSKGITI